MSAMSSKFCFLFLAGLEAKRLVGHISMSLVAHKHAFQILEGVSPPFVLLRFFQERARRSRVYKLLPLNKKHELRT